MFGYRMKKEQYSLKAASLQARPISNWERSLVKTPSIVPDSPGRLPIRKRSYL